MPQDISQLLRELNTVFSNGRKFSLRFGVEVTIVEGEDPEDLDAEALSNPMPCTISDALDLLTLVNGCCPNGVAPLPFEDIDDEEAGGQFFPACTLEPTENCVWVDYDSDEDDEDNELFTINPPTQIAELITKLIAHSKQPKTTAQAS